MLYSVMTTDYFVFFNVSVNPRYQHQPLSGLGLGLALPPQPHNLSWMLYSVMTTDYFVFFNVSP